MNEALALTLVVSFVVLVVVQIAALEIVRRRVVGRLGPEGIKLRTGLVTVHVMLSDRPWYPSLPGEVVLTRQALTIVAARTYRFEADDLVHLCLRSEKGRLWLSTERPPRDTGLLEVDFAVSDEAAWMAALTEHGAKTR